MINANILSSKKNKTKDLQRGVIMGVIQEILRRLQNALEYFNETGDAKDLVSDIEDMISNLMLGILE